MSYKYLGYLKVNRRGILKCILQAKIVNDKYELTEIYNANVFMAVGEINWNRLNLIAVVPLPEFSSRFYNLPPTLILQGSDQTSHILTQCHCWVIGITYLVIFWYLDCYYLDLSHLLFKLEEFLFEYSESLRKLIQARFSYWKEYCPFFFLTIFPPPQKKTL